MKTLANFALICRDNSQIGFTVIATLPLSRYGFREAQRLIGKRFGHPPTSSTYDSTVGPGRPCLMVDLGNSNSSWSRIVISYSSLMRYSDLIQIIDDSYSATHVVGALSRNQGVHYPLSDASLDKDKLGGMPCVTLDISLGTHMCVSYEGFQSFAVGNHKGELLISGEYHLSEYKGLLTLTYQDDLVS